MKVLGVILLIIGIVGFALGSTGGSNFEMVKFFYSAYAVAMSILLGVLFICL